MALFTFTYVFSQEFFFSEESAKSISLYEMEMLMYGFLNNVGSQGYLYGPEQAKMIAFLLKNLKRVKKFNISRNKSLRQEVFTLIYINYVLSEKEKEDLYSLYKFKKSAMLPHLAKSLLHNNLMCFPIKRSVINTIALQCSKEKKSLRLKKEHYQPFIILHKNKITLAKTLIDLYGAENLSCHEYYRELYFDFYDHHKTKYVLSKLCIQESKFTTAAYYQSPSLWTKDETKSSPFYNMWNVNFSCNFKSNQNLKLFIEERKDFVNDQFKKHFPMFESLSGFKNNVMRKYWFMIRVIESNLILPKGDIKKGFKELFGINSAKMINYVSQKAETLNPNEFVEFLLKSAIYQKLFPDNHNAIWSLHNTKNTQAGSYQYFLDYNDKFKAIFSEAQQLDFILKNQIQFNQSTISVEHRQNLSYLRDTFSRCLNKEVIEQLKDYSFNEKNTIKKLHDLSSQLYTKSIHKDRNLHLNQLYPSIDKLDRQELTSGKRLLVPRTKHQLLDWGNSLRICVGSYDKDIESGHTLVLGVSENNRIYACIEIRASRELQSILMKLENPFADRNGWINPMGADILSMNIQEKRKEVLKSLQGHIGVLKYSKNSLEVIQYRKFANGDASGEESKEILNLVCSTIHNEIIDTLVNKAMTNDFQVFNHLRRMHLWDR